MAEITMDLEQEDEGAADELTGEEAGVENEDLIPT
jgi:hypothetical protein